MKHILKILLILLLASLTVQAQDDFPQPAKAKNGGYTPVNDFAKIFTDSQNDDLYRMLVTYNDTTSTQIYVVTVEDLKGYQPSDYATRLGEKWGVGQKGKNNGIIILIKPRVGNERGQVFIATGYGVEHILTDARTGRIIDRDMMPYLQSGDYYNASKAAIEAIMKYLSGEFKADEKDDENRSPLSIIIQIIIIVAIIYIMYKGSKNSGNTGSSNRGRRSPWGGFFGGGFGSGSSGGGWSGGSFGGGGGGSFGGGGAGRSF